MRLYIMTLYSLNIMHDVIPVSLLIYIDSYLSIYSVIVHTRVYYPKNCN